MSKEPGERKRGFLDKLEEKLQKKLDREDEERNNGFHHSTRYHDFFEGYAEARVPNQDGKGSHIERVYMGDYYRQNVSDGRRIALRLLYVGLYLLSAALFVYGMEQRVRSNLALFVAAPGLLSVLVYVLMLPILISYVTQPRDMTVWGYRSSSKRLKKLSLVAAALVLTTAVTVIAYCMWDIQDDIGSELMCIVCYVLSSVCMGGIGLVERTVDYTTAPSTNRPSGDKIMIR